MILLLSTETIEVTEMNYARTRKAVADLQEMVGMLREDGIGSSERFGPWKKNHLPELNRLFGFEEMENCPPINSLFGADFHPGLPLIMFNYTPTAHNTLHACPEGWTDQLRLCRGIVFDLETGELVAQPFPKFFNYLENPETMACPEGKFEATEKMDGHLGIIFRYCDQLMLTTRGRFTSPTSILAGEMLAKISGSHHWPGLPNGLTVLAEIIAPETRVLTDYDFQGFVLIGAYECHQSKDYHYLETMAEMLGLPLTKIWPGSSLPELVELMRDRSITGDEGFVVRFDPDDLRIKFKYESYIGKMVAAKLGYTYVMNRLISGSAEKMLSTLPEEIFGQALQMCGQLMLILGKPGDQKSKWRRIYELVPAEERTAYFQSVCRNFVKHFSN